MDQVSVGIVANIDKSGAKEALGRLLKSLARNGLTAILEDRTAKFIAQGEGAPLEDLAKRCSLLAVLGGDGTMLSVVRRLREQGPPLLGINLGSLGFLTCATVEAIDQVGGWIAKGECQIAERDVIQAAVLVGERERATYFGVNEVAVVRGSVSRIIQLETRVNGEFVNCYNADGLIVATPTGSTAYSLAAGGPIIDPRSEVFVITPICPHALSNRSIVVPNGDIVDIVPMKARDEALLTLDGQTLQTIEPKSRIRVSRAAHSVKLAYLPKQSFFGTLHQKMRWHGSNVK